jgi:hypothetical protein
MAKNNDGFAARQGGFQITKNNLTLSVQFGFGSYSENGRKLDSIEQVKKWPGQEFSANAEIALFDTGGDWQTIRIFNEIGWEELTDDVVGHGPVEKVVGLIAWLHEHDWKKKGEK